MVGIHNIFKWSTSLHGLSRVEDRMAILKWLSIGILSTVAVISYYLNKYCYTLDNPFTPLDYNLVCYDTPVTDYINLEMVTMMLLNRQHIISVRLLGGRTFKLYHLKNE